MIDLSNQQPFAAGYNRNCFIHPENPALCLKVLRPENIEKRFARMPWYKKVLGKSRINDNQQELKAYRQPAVINGGPRIWEHLPRFYGCELTSRGPANVSELVTETNGTPGSTFETYLQEHGLDTAAEAAAACFCDWLRATGVLTRNLLPHNFVVIHRHEQLELYLVDGLGAPDVPAKLARIPAYRRRYIERKILRFRNRIQWEIRGRPGSWKAAERIRYRSL